MNHIRNTNNHQGFHVCWMVGVAMLCLSLFTVTVNVKAASKDKKKPSLQVTTVTQEYAKKVKLQVQAKDASGIQEVKYAAGSQKTSYFKSKGKKVNIKSGKGTVNVTKNGTYTFYAKDKAGNTKLTKVSVELVDETAPILNLSYDVKSQVATISVAAVDLETAIKEISYLSGEVALDDSAWETSIPLIDTTQFEVTESGIYTVKVVDGVGNTTIESIQITMEFKAMWISYLEFNSNGSTEQEFSERIDQMFDRCVELGMNAVVVQVRMFSDAMYQSKYFPWSKYASGSQGLDPGYDPMKMMIEKAHERGLEFHAWLNPYRVTTNNTNVDTLAKKNPARKWLTDSDDSNDRNVLKFNNNLYYNPGRAQSRNLIVNGVKEIVQNYDVDGIHFDDYFYPYLGGNYRKVFDAPEYEEYVEKQTEAGKPVKDIADWRRLNVNVMVRNVYKAIKEINPNCQFGISPHGNLDNLDSNMSYYVDYKTWLTKEGYVDYICPQLYWSFEHKTCAYDRLLNRWVAVRTNPNVRIYAGLAVYRALRDKEPGWEDKNVLANMVTSGRDTGEVDGYLFFRYDFFQDRTCKPAVDALLEVLPKR